MKNRICIPFITNNLLSIALAGVIAHASIPWDHGNHSLSNRPILVSTPFLDQCSGAALVAEKIISSPLTLHVTTAADCPYHVKTGLSVSVCVNKRLFAPEPPHVSEDPIWDCGDFEDYVSGGNQTHLDHFAHSSGFFPESGCSPLSA